MSRQSSRGARLPAGRAAGTGSGRRRRVGAQRGAGGRDVGDTGELDIADPARAAFIVVGAGSRAIPVGHRSDGSARTDAGGAPPTT